MILSQLAMAAPTQRCEGVDILYPTSNVAIDHHNEKTAYLVLGSKVRHAKLKKVELVHKKGEKDVSKQVFKGTSGLNRILALQQDLSGLDLPNQFWFSVDVEQNGQTCRYQSQTFKITH
ncbi:hypothetical protein EC973_006796 [Apophysomyces ossiformis]|uniref:Uncharacterized protein n=1 Tax=Apophysomyces ossiformis TaxID=679940 RepID=A0A8H7ES48_9FUNG|nr:hypothetical protein EC973_006796 [Apophysomyces ossiformis]